MLCAAVYIWNPLYSPHIRCLKTRHACCSTSGTSRLPTCAQFDSGLDNEAHQQAMVIAERFLVHIKTCTNTPTPPYGLSSASCACGAGGIKPSPGHAQHDCFLRARIEKKKESICMVAAGLYASAHLCACTQDCAFVLSTNIGCRILLCVKVQAGASHA